MCTLLKVIILAKSSFDGGVQWSKVRGFIDSPVHSGGEHERRSVVTAFNLGENWSSLAALRYREMCFSSRPESNG